MEKIWANSGDSHLVEPADLFESSLPPALAERMPRSEVDDDRQWETIHVDGQSFRRRFPLGRLMVDGDGRTVTERAPGANDPALRLVDLDAEGVWAELIYPSIGIWTASIHDPDLLAAGCAAINDWAIEYQRHSPRYVCTATVPVLNAATAVAEIERAADLGFDAAYFPVEPPTEGGLEPPDVGAGVGGARRPRPRVLLPHRHRTARRQPHPRRVLPAGRAARSSTTSRPRTAASEQSASSSRPGCSTGTPRCA